MTAPAASDRSESAIVVEHLVKKFGELTADDDITFTVQRDEIFGLLGPNGAGKSTLVRMLTTLLKPTSGRALVMGQDVVRRTAAVRREIGVIPQAITVDNDLTAWESLDIYGKFYGIGAAERRTRAQALLSVVGLWDWRDKPAGTYSGGMKRRLEIARGLIHRPRVFFLDEPTTGLDPQSRRVVWELLERLRDEGGLTILLSTHYMDEADRLCDRLAIIDHGKIVALGTPSELKDTVPGQHVLLAEFFDEIHDDLLAALRTIPDVREAAPQDPHVARLVLTSETAPLDALLETARRFGTRVKSVSVEEPTLEDVFIHYTGRGLRDTVASEYTMQIPSMMR